MWADAQGPTAAAKRAMDRATKSLPLSARDVRALLAHSCVIAEYMGGAAEGVPFSTKATPDGRDALVIEVPAPPARDPGVRELQFAIMATWETLARGLPPPTAGQVVLVTEDNAPVVPDAGMAPVVAGVIVAVVAIGAVGQAYAVHVIAEHASQVVDRYLDRREDSARLMTAQANALRIAERHADDERRAGASIPLSPPEQAILGSLLTYVEEFRKKLDPPKPSGPLESGSSGTLVLAAAAVAALIVITKGQ